ncbi:MAG: hypothetical protein LBU14_04960 [Candidatus Peribacteria bacterium]|nr:hypothetical protein [Candidatus Peribacteria bacterium]
MYCSFVNILFFTLSITVPLDIAQVSVVVPLFVYVVFVVVLEFPLFVVVY